MIKNTEKYGIFLALLSAVLYALSTPFSKILLEKIPSTMMAGLLYIGAGIGMGAIAFFRKKTGRNSENGKFTKAEMPYVFAMILLDIAAPIFLLVGLKSTTAASDIFTQDVEDLPMYMFQQQQPQQVRATVEAAPNPEDIAQLKAMTEELAGMGYDVDATKRYLWGVYKQSGIDAAKAEADGMREAAQQPDGGEQQEPEQDALLPDDVEF